MAAISLDRLSKRYGGNPVLDAVSLDIQDGEFLTLLGPSGCGKSTLLRVIAGLESQDSGGVAIGGVAVDGLRPKQRDVAMVFQSYALYPHMTVAANMALPLKMRRLTLLQRLPIVCRLLARTRATLRQIEEDVRRTAAALEIEHVLDRKPGQLSGGQRQRVAVGRAMVRRPSVFLMDEPLSNLDAKLRVTMRAEIKELHRRLGVTFVYVTHDQAEAMTLSDRVAVMLDGKLRQVGRPLEIYADPAERRVAEFIGSPKITMIEARVGEGGQVHVGSRLLPIETAQPPGSLIVLGIRPEAFTLVAPGAEGELLAGRVRLVEHLGSDLYIHLEGAGQAEPVIARLDAAQAPHIGIGEQIHLAVHAERMLLFASDGRRIRAATDRRPVAVVSGLRAAARAEYAR
ncbi:fused maltose transport subunit, ATP-binding component of ABC superfamily; regulatory protein [Bradyrhizobium sp. STM 3843]|uniref:ABC transporter ATP-binding protein n=1 Tax=Bradyrhizobium sp. STM 3843 TaxID=551947 RepID=UPI0002403D2B|nr:ABC transporter ATP-binding protein [Bradyrhizobium sp. STM 3843]CCE09731.1 fused maltose transport subunit, ATP-binding component of ABC superfamily; regulatory protein [Bradyrhizobium sp. STM 3843]